MADEVVKIVDPDNGGGTDYTSIDAWEDAFGGTTGGGTPGNLPAGDEIGVAECRASSGGDDTSPVNIVGWTTDATRYIEIRLHSDETNTGIWNDSNYVHHNNNSDVSSIIISEDYVRVRNIQTLLTTSSGTRRIFNVVALSTSNIIFDSCIVKGICSGTGDGHGFRIFDSDAIVKIYNTVVYGFISGADTGFAGIWAADCTTVDIYNCTIAGNYKGIEQDAGTVTAINCALFNNTDDFNGTITIGYCASDQSGGSGVGGVDISGTWDTTCFTDPEASPPDFSVQDVDSPVYNTGNGATPKSTFIDDIIGTTRGPADLDWDIGAFELVVVSGIVILRRRRECA